MKRLIVLSFVICHLASSPAGAQGWTQQQCMQYAVEHNHQVKQAELELDSYQAAQTGALGRFLPAVDGAVGIQYSFGRTIDPETNGYTDVSTFYNGYQLSASLPVFDGFSRLHALRAAKASVLMGRAGLRQQQDLTALSVLQAYADAVFCDAMVAMAREKLHEAELLLKQTRVQEEVGRKSAADVALMEAQQAEAAYELTRQQGRQATALLELKKEMGYPLNEELRMENEEFATAISEAQPSGAAANSSLSTLHPSLQASRYQMEAAKHEWRQVRASLFPSLSLSAGLNTTYFHTLHVADAQSFSRQLHNNMGEYVGLSLSIPLFNRLQSITGMRRAKNSYNIAREAYEQKLLELEKQSREAWQDWQNYRKQTEQMEKKVKADSLAYQLTRRQYEEGLATAIDLHATSAQLLQSRATLLQCRLMVMVKHELVRYYNGEQIWTE